MISILRLLVGKIKNHAIIDIVALMKKMQCGAENLIKIIVVRWIKIL